MKPHILFLMGSFPSYGGVEKVSAVLANKFIDDGYGVTIASFEQPAPEFAEKFLNEECHLLKLTYPVLSRRNYQTLHQYIIENKVKILINQWALPFFTTLLWKYALKRTSCKVYSVHHNRPNFNNRILELDAKIKAGRFYLIPLRWLLNEVSRMSLAYCIRSSDKYIVLSPSFIPIAKNYSRINEDSKYMALPNPVTIALPEEKQWKKKKEIICVGRIEYEQKRTYRVVDIWKELEDKHPDWYLTFVGDGPDKADLEQRIQASGLERASITGFVDPTPFYKDASIMLMTSDCEGFGLVLVEGMCYGVVPMVYDSFEAVHDIITNDVNGLIVPQPFNVKRFSADVERLMTNYEQLKRMSNKATEISKKFSVESIKKEWYSLFNS